MTEVLTTSAQKVRPIIHIVVICQNGDPYCFHEIGTILDAERSKRKKKPKHLRNLLKDLISKILFWVLIWMKS